jgi:hypothetical protein
MSLHDTHPSLPAPLEGQSGERNTASFADQNSDYKVLSGLLEYSESRTSAFELLQRFPSIGHVISAEPSQLHAFGLTARDVALFSLIRETACRMAKAAVRTRSALSNWQAVSRRHRDDPTIEGRGKCARARAARPYRDRPRHSRFLPLSWVALASPGDRSLPKALRSGFLGGMETKSRLVAGGGP